MRGKGSYLKRSLVIVTKRKGWDWQLDDRAHGTWEMFVWKAPGCSEQGWGPWGSGGLCWCQPSAQPGISPSLHPHPEPSWWKGAAGGISPISAGPSTPTAQANMAFTSLANKAT